MKNDSQERALLISFIMPVYNPLEPFFDLAVQSVLSQKFSNWELCMADDGSSDPSVWPKLQAYSQANARIKIFHRSQNGHISRATNSAAALAKGDFLAFIDQDDLLAPHCLELLTNYIEENSNTDLLYTDDDKIDACGKHYAEQFKQDYDPYQLLSFMMMGHILCVRRSLFERLGGFRTGFEGSQDYDFALRAIEHSRHVGHIPAIAYHWRSLPGSTASGGNEKEYSFDAGMRAVQEALDRRNIPAKAIHPEWARASGCGLFGVEFSPGPTVTVIIPVTSQELLPSPEVINEYLKVEYPHVFFLLVINETLSVPKFPPSIQTLKTSAHRWAALCNAALQFATTPLLVFLSPSLTPQNNIWLTQLAGWACLPEVGCVGGKITQQDGTLLHAGYLHEQGKDGLPGRVGYGSKDSWGDHFRHVTPSKCSAVSRHCFAIGREKLIKAGGFDDVNFPDDLSGADLGYRLAACNISNLFCPEALFKCSAPDIFMSRTYDAISTFKHRHTELPPSANSNILSGSSFFDCRHKQPNGANASLKTLFITHSLALEGAPKTLYELAAGLAKRKIPLEVWSHLEGPLLNTYTEAGISVSIIPSQQNKGCNQSSLSDLDIYVLNNLNFLPMDCESSYNRTIQDFARNISEKKIKILVANTILSFWAVDAAMRANIPCVWIIRESEKPLLHLEQLPAFIRSKAKQLFTFPYKIVFVAKATMELFADYLTVKNSIVIHNALSNQFISAYNELKREQARASLGFCDDTTVYLILGSVFERKGQIDVIRACAQIDEQYLKNIHFLIVGDRPGTKYSEKLHKEIQSLSIKRQRHVTVLEETSHPEIFYKVADVFICCSRIESFPRVILESMHCALPIITTPVFGIREQVKDRESAVFYNPADITELCRHIVSFAGNTKLQRQYGSKAREALDQLPNYNLMLTEYETLLQEATME